MPKIEKDLLKVKGSDGQWHYIPAVGDSSTPTWNAVQNKPFTTLGDGLSVDENGVLSVPEGGGGSANAVQYVEQKLTDAQKTQARTNIDADKKRLIYNATRGNYGRVNLFDSVSSQNAAIDKIIAEYKAGTEVIMRLQDRDFPLNQIEENAGEIWFSSYSVTTDAKVNVVTFVLKKDTTAVEENYINGIKTVDIDSTLRISDYAADAKAVGDALDTKLDKNQGTDNAGKILGVGEDGNVIPQDKPTYTLPQATADALGGIKADAATAEDTQDVRIGADGKLKTKPTGGSTVTVDSELSSTSVNPVQNKVVTAALAGKITAPTTAAVGQIIKVKSVDDAGKPTEWEAGDLYSTMPLIFREIVPAGLAEWVRTTDASGKTFNLKRWELWIRFPFAQGITDKTATLYINDGSTYSGTTMYYNDTSVPCYYYQLGDYIAQNYKEMKMRENYTHQARIARGNGSTAFNKCSKIRINTFSDTVKIPGNTEVTLFGVE